MNVNENENPHAGQGSVLLDIGGDVGALVVTMPPAMVGVEIEIAPLGGAGPRGTTTGTTTGTITGTTTSTGMRTRTARTSRSWTDP